MRDDLRAGLAAATLCAGLGAPVALAEDNGALVAPQPAAQSGGFALSEVRAGVFAHSVYSGFFPVMPARWLTLSRIEDLNVELLFDLPDADLVRWIGSPRLNLGGTANFAGRESMAHLALTWTVPVFDTPVFIEGTFGGAINNSQLAASVAPARDMGCNVGFYESASIGVNVSEQASVMLTYEHSSNLDLCPPNAGISNLGIRFGMKLN